MSLQYQFITYINATPEQVWQTLVSPEGSRACFFGSTLQSTFEVGSPYQYVGPGKDGDETVHVYGEILAFEPNRLFSATEHPGPSYNPRHAELETRYTFTLEPVGDTTKLTLVSEILTPDHPFSESFKETWPMILSSIKTFAETGKTLNFG